MKKTTLFLLLALLLTPLAFAKSNPHSGGGRSLGTRFARMFGRGEARAATRAGAQGKARQASQLINPVGAKKNISPKTQQQPQK